MMFHENQQVQLLSDADDFDTVDSGPGGNTDWVRDCTRFHIELRYRMDGTMDLRRVNCTLVDKQHVRRLPMHMYLGMIESYDRRPVSHVFIVILRLDDMGVGSSRACTLEGPAEGGWFLMHHVNVAWIVRPQAKKQSIQPPSMT